MRLAGGYTNADLCIMKYRFESPFGENSCEREKAILKEDYPRYYFENSQFGKKALARQTYLIVGRRGAGKSSLIEYFSFHNKRKPTRCIDINEPEIYQVVLEKVARILQENSDFPMPKIRLLWEYVIWALIFKEYSDKEGIIRAADLLDYKEEHKVSPSRIILKVIQSLVARFTGINKNEIDDILDDIKTKISSEVFEKAKAQVLEHSRVEEAIIAIDSIEDYPVSNNAMMNSIASLIEFASEFNLQYNPGGLHLKVFVSAEVFPHLITSVISNPLKFVKDPLFLHWRPKDLLRFICWRWYIYLKDTKQIDRDMEIDFDRPQHIMEKLWTPYFGSELKNASGYTEPSFPYILRHTQLRPRQLVIICNKLFNISKDNDFVPRVTGESIREAISSVEFDLSNEIINAYKKIYENADRILDALTGLPMVFKGKDLDRVARRTVSQWHNQDYSSYNFRAIVAELGIVGKIRNYDEKTGIIAADFEFCQRSRLSITESDDCVFHPLFFKKFNVQRTIPNAIVYPFPDHPDYEL
jgi:hypothetical protein